LDVLERKHKGCLLANSCVQEALSSTETVYLQKRSQATLVWRLSHKPGGVWRKGGMVGCRIQLWSAFPGWACHPRTIPDATEFRTEAPTRLSLSIKKSWLFCPGGLIPRSCASSGEGSPGF